MSPQKNEEKRFYVSVNRECGDPIFELRDRLQEQGWTLIAEFYPHGWKNARLEIEKLAARLNGEAEPSKEGVENVRVEDLERRVTNLEKALRGKMSDPKQETLRELLASLDKASKVEPKNADSAIARMAARICAERLAPIVERLDKLDIYREAVQPLESSDSEQLIDLKHLWVDKKHRVLMELCDKLREILGRKE